MDFSELKKCDDHLKPRHSKFNYFVEVIKACEFLGYINLSISNEYYVELKNCYKNKSENDKISNIKSHIVKLYNSFLSEELDKDFLKTLLGDKIKLNFIYTYSDGWERV